MSELPTGTVTFLFTDIEGSTRLLQELGREDYAQLQDRHAAIMRSAIANGGGTAIRTEGDSFFAVFPTATGAVRSAVTAQRQLASFVWPGDRRIRVRMGMHTGEGVLGGDDYVGIDVNRAARIAAIGHGEQVVLSDVTRALLAGGLPEGVATRDLGSHRMKDIEHPEHLHDLIVDGLPAEFPPLRSLEGRRTNLPPLRTSFVGRAREILEVGRLLDDARVLTLTGPGGTGKTRLALKVASGRLDHYRDGVIFVDLSAVTDPDVMIIEIAGALRIAETSGRDLTTTIHEHLRERELLLVLDNLEQLTQASPVLGAIVDEAPNVRVLATSRIPLRLSGETEYRVSPLALPERGADLDHLTSCESVRLFVDRAGAVRPGFDITAERAHAIGQIVARLDGLPLALELAASRLRVLDLDGLASRLEHRLPMLTGGARDAPERQRTLEDTIRWSHELLEPDEQRLFARLSVFAGGWTLEAAETVCGGDLDVLESLGTLVEDSLVRRSERSDGALRFTMLETIKEYAAARFEATDATERRSVERRHAGFFAELAEEAEPFLTREHQMRWLAILDRENDNMRAAVDRGLRTEGDDDVRSALRIAASVWRFWHFRRQLVESGPKVQRLLDLPGAQGHDSLRCRALRALGSIAYWQQDYEHVAAPYEEAVAIAREIGEPRLLSWSIYDAAYVPLVVRQQFADGRAMLDESLALAVEGDLYLRGQIWTAFAYARLFEGDVAGATEALERALEIHRDAGDSIFIMEDLVGLAGVAISAGDLETARRRVDDANEAAIASSHPISFAGVMHPNAHLASHGGRHREAVRLIGAYERLGQDFGALIPEVGLAFFGDPIEAAKQAIGEEATDRARAEGFAMNLDEIQDLLRGGSDDRE